MTKNNSLARMKWHRRPAAVLIAMCCLTFTANGAQSSFVEGSASVFAERVRTAHTGEYQRVLGEFDTYLARFPGDAIASVERCKFIDEFAYVEDLSVETVLEDAEKCEESLRTGPNTESGAVKLYLWSSRIWEDSIAEGESLLRGYSSWTVLQRAALHEGLSNRFEESDSLRAGDHATKAVLLDPNSSMRMRAAEHYITTGAKMRAISTVQAMPRGEWNAYTLQSAVTMLLNLGETVAARELVETNKDIDLPPASRIKLAQAMLAAGDEQAGRALSQTVLDGEKSSESYGARLEQEVFDLQLHYGSAAEAEIAYRALRNKGFDADAFARRRLALTMTHWGAPWQLEDLLGIGAVLISLAAVCLLPLLVIVPIHHRSVVKRLSGFVVAAAGPESPWSLRSVWYALTVSSSIGVIALYFLSYPDFEAIFGRFFGVPGIFDPPTDDRALGRALFWGSLLTLAMLLPLLRKANVGTLLLGRWSVRRSILSGAGMAILLLILNAIIIGIFRIYSQTGVGLGSDTVRSLQGIYSVYGVLGLLVCAAVVVPTIEEFIFRGVLLRSAARHLNIWVSVLVQAVVFVALHESPAAFPFLFVFAIVTSWLALRSGGLLAPIALHAVNNAFAVMAILRLTKAAGG